MGKYRILVSGGGTGGHIFPALSIANGIKEKYPDAEILFVGAENRMEMEKVPAAGYRLACQRIRQKEHFQEFLRSAKTDEKHQNG